MSSRALAAAAALVLGCAHPQPRTASAPADAPLPPPKLAQAITCASGDVIPRGGELPRLTSFSTGVAVDDTSARADAVVTGACTAHEAIAKCVRDSKYPRGKVALALSISPEGKLLGGKRAGGSIEDAQFVACVTHALAGATFASAAAGETTYELTFAPTRVVKMTEIGTDIRGRLAPELIKRELRRNFPRLRKCYERLLRKRGEVNGTLTFDFVIRIDGTVKSLNVDFTESFNDTDLLNCAADVMSKLVFAEPESLVAVHYPIAFETESE